MVTGSDRNGKRFFLNPERSAGWSSSEPGWGPGEGPAFEALPFSSQWPRSGALLLRFFRWVFAHRFAAQFDAVSTMNDTVQDTLGQSGVADLPMPLAPRPFPRHHPRA